MTERITAAQLKAVQPRQRANKYGAKKVSIDGVVFDSKSEAKRYCALRDLEKAGVIKNLELQPSFVFDHKGWRICKYTADFRYVDSEGVSVVEDVKGYAGNSYDTLRRKLIEAEYGVSIRLVTGEGKTKKERSLPKKKRAA